MKIVPGPSVDLVDEGPLFALNAVRVMGFDGAYSIPLADGRSLWYFGDTLIGERRPEASLWYPDGERIGGREMTGLGGVEGMVTNSGILVSADTRSGPDPRSAPWVFVADRDGRPREMVTRKPSEIDGKLRAWCLHGIDLPDGPCLFYQVIRILDEDLGLPVCFDIVGSGLARGDRESLAFARLDSRGQESPDGELYFDAFEPQFAASVLARGGWLYLYGVRKGAHFSQQTCVARVVPENLARRKAWEYWDGSTWSREVAMAATIFEGAPNELSVSYNAWLGGYLAIHSVAMTGRIVARTAPAPEGPWSAEVLIAEVFPDADRSLPYPFLVYAAKEHPELAAEGGRWVALTFVEFEEYLPHLLTIDLKDFH